METAEPYTDEACSAQTSAKAAAGELSRLLGYLDQRMTKWERDVKKLNDRQNNPATSEDDQIWETAAAALIEIEHLDRALRTQTRMIQRALKQTQSWAKTIVKDRYPRR